MSAQEITDLKRRGLMLVLSSPSGAGKTTLARRLLEKHYDAPSGESIMMSISVTTRTMRPGEADGRDYFFISPAKFQDMARAGALLEDARVFGHQYGTPAKFVEDNLTKGVDVLFDIDWQGTQQLKQQRRDDLVSVFILPPSLGELERRLQQRAQDPADVVRKRMEQAVSEISHWREYDYVLINRDVDATLVKIDMILKAERLKRVRQKDLPAFISSLR